MPQNDPELLARIAAEIERQETLIATLKQMMAAAESGGEPPKQRCT